MNALKELEEIRKRKKELETLEKETLNPVLTNFDNLLLIQEWFEYLASQKENFPKSSSIEYRQRYLFIVALLYSPGTLLGDSLIRGLRNRLAELFHISTYAVSHSLKSVWFYYCHYKDFKEDVDYIYSEILFRIELHRLK